jgi:hypothetical protein
LAPKEKRKQVGFNFFERLGLMSELLVVCLFVFVPIGLAPFITQWLDAHGLPGLLFAVLLILLGPAIAIFGLDRERASRRRARAMRRTASQLGLKFSAWFRVPRSLRELPSLAGLTILVGPQRWSTRRGFADLISGPVEDSHVLVFDYWVKTDGAYAQTRWHTMAATHIGSGGQSLLVEPRGIASLAPAVGFDEVGTESETVNERYRVLTNDPAFASAFLDARMMQYLLDQKHAWIFEVSANWLAVTSHQIPVELIGELIEALQGFRRHIPRVISSLYPAPGPTFV